MVSCHRSHYHDVVRSMSRCSFTRTEWRLDVAAFARRVSRQRASDDCTTHRLDASDVNKVQKAAEAGTGLLLVAECKPENSSPGVSKQQG